MSINRAGWLRATACVTAAGLALAGCAKKENTGTGETQPSAGWPETPDVQIVEGKPGGTFRLGIVEPTAIDPYNTQESEGTMVAYQLFTGLVRVEPDGSVQPAVADKWETNDDCSQWTFNLRTGTKFSNGEPVNAEAFKRGWTRATVKTAASEVSYHLKGILGYKALQDGSATAFAGVDATDPAKLVVKMEEPDCEFYLRTFHPVFSPVPTVAGAADNKTYNDMPIGNGRFKMSGPWQHDRGIKLVRNDDFGVGEKAYLDAIEITITPNGAQDEMDGFVNGTFDWARMPTPQFSDMRNKYEPEGKWLRKSTSGMNYLLPMVTQKPLDSADARKAISMAIDRNAIIEGVFKGSQIPSTTIVPPSFESAYQSGVCTACSYNLDEAKKLAQESGLTPGTTLNMQLNTGGGHEEWMAAIKQQLEKNLGLTVNMTAVNFDDMLNNEQQPGATGLFRAAWSADYPTPRNFLEPLLATSSIGAGPSEPTTGDNRGRYSNAKFDDLINEGKASKDPAEAVSKYKEAEKVAIGDDLALIPLWNRTQNRLIASDKFVNLRMDFSENPDFSVISIK
ncbi:MAG TPA: ABC transporter substrate-binding protein [Actinophytocola sp.]|uniref:peptide ABC transporter substrate-binding protein n=1 Tax=Actinophytocola sp. TaxID=1872138 RepID=UPI002DB91D9C|nr:ABC transporter substrate-binding protein [Actinophytocola sp.]HEU5472095.1 ABC transporter substrate-binding protein [Actinophytocola sp.]